MTSTGDDLLAAIWARPHDDLPRLAYADWLEERGDGSRAEFIRVQCELARLDATDPPEPGREIMAGWGCTQFPRVPDTPHRAGLAARADRLRKANAAAWKAGAPKPLAASPYHRGFLHPPLKLVTGPKLAGLPADLLAAAPLWEFALNTVPADRVLRARPPALARCWRLRAELTEGFARHLIDGAAPNLAALSFATPARDLATGTIGDLLASPYLPHLATINARYAGLPVGAVADALTRPGPPLRSVGLFGTHLTDADVTAVLDSARTAGLRELDLGQNREVTAAVWERLARSPRLATVRYLDLDNNPAVGDEVAVALAANPHAAGLRVLRLASTRVGDAGAIALAGSPHLDGLAALLLSEVKVRRDGRAAAALRKRFGDRIYLGN
jgi:uncharacterized protein (TIGR02996 family)